MNLILETAHQRQNPTASVLARVADFTQQYVLEVYTLFFNPELWMGKERMFLLVLPPPTFLLASISEVRDSEGKCLSRGYICTKP